MWVQPKSHNLRAAAVLGRNSHCGARCGDRIFYFGGRSDESSLSPNTLVLHDLSSNSWQQLELPSSPCAREEHAMTFVGGNLYLFGGAGAGGVLLNDMHVFRLDTVSWGVVAQKGQVPPPLAGHSLTYYEGRLYLFGGSTRQSERTRQLQEKAGGVVDSTDVSNQLYSFDVTTGEWTLVPTRKAPPPRALHSACVVEGRLHIFGGRGMFGCLNDLHIFDAARREWQLPGITGVFPAARWGHSNATTVLGHQMLVFGGWNGTFCFDDVFMFDAVHMCWASLLTSGPRPSARAFHTAVLVDNLLLVAGGRTLLSRLSDCLALDVRRYAPPGLPVRSNGAVAAAAALSRVHTGGVGVGQGGKTGLGLGLAGPGAGHANATAAVPLPFGQLLWAPTPDPLLRALGTGEEYKRSTTGLLPAVLLPAAASASSGSALSTGAGTPPVTSPVNASGRTTPLRINIMRGSGLLLSPQAQRALTATPPPVLPPIAHRSGGGSVVSGMGPLRGTPTKAPLLPDVPQDASGGGGGNGSANSPVHSGANGSGNNNVVVTGSAGGGGNKISILFTAPSSTVVGSAGASSSVLPPARLSQLSQPPQLAGESKHSSDASGNGGRQQQQPDQPLMGGIVGGRTGSMVINLPGVPRPIADPTGGSAFAVTAAVAHKRAAYNWRLSDFKIMQTLGTGSFGRVRLCKHEPSDRFYAIKILKKKEIIKLKQVEHILNERSILMDIDHPFIVNLRCTFQDTRYVYLVMDYVVGGEFFSHLRRSRRFNNKIAQFYAAHIVLVFQYLHSKDIVYRDLKPENLLLDRTGHLKITDFGFAKRVETRTWTLCGTPEYIAPEILLNKGHGKPVDWWALGVLIYEMLAGNPPWVDESPLGIYKKILDGKISWPRHFSDSAKDLVKKLLTPDITKRLGNLKNGAADIKNHKWFADMDWTALYNYQLKAPWVPKVAHDGDTAHFDKYPDSDTLPEEVILEKDPFKDF